MNNQQRYVEKMINQMSHAAGTAWIVTNLNFEPLAPEQLTELRRTVADLEVAIRRVKTNFLEGTNHALSETTTRTTHRDPGTGECSDLGDRDGSPG